MHRDPLLSTGKRPFFHWGHLWVVVSIAVPAFGKTWALPVLFRLYRGKKRCKAEKRPYRKCPELAAELIKVLAEALSDRRIIVVGDSAYTNGSVTRGGCWSHMRRKLFEARSTSAAEDIDPALGIIREIFRVEHDATEQVRCENLPGSVEHVLFCGQTFVPNQLANDVAADADLAGGLDHREAVPILQGGLVA
jgi:hypothetical protein